MEAYFPLMVQSVGAGFALGLVFLSLSFGFSCVAGFLHTAFKP